MPHKLGDLTWQAVGSTLERILVVPVGATEQHGPHLPMSTDTDIACALAQRLATVRPDQIVVSPPIAFGSSGEHQGFPGTISVGAEATKLLLVELCRSATQTWPRVLLISTHGGNRDPVNAAVRLLRHESRDVRRWMPDWSGDHHAGRTETSVMLALDETRVGAYGEVVGSTEPLEQLLPQMRIGGLAAVSPTGVLGDARTATAALGDRLLAQATDELIAMVRDWERQ